MKWRMYRLMQNRTTNIVRSRETLEQVFVGLYPPGKIRATPKILERLAFEENLYPIIYNCKRLKQVMKQFANMAAAKWNPVLEGAPSAAIREILPTKDSVVTVGTSSDKNKESNNAWEIVDTYMSAKTHRFATPRGFEEPGVINTLIDAAMDEEFVAFSKHPEAQKLGMGRFLGEVVERMIGPAGEYTKYSSLMAPVKMHLYAAHDSSVGSVLSTLGVFDKKWINYTSHVIFEVFEKPAQSGLLSKKPFELFVRVKYNGKPMKLPACQASGKHMNDDTSMCTMAAFRDLIYSVSPRNWEEECSKTEPE